MGIQARQIVGFARKKGFLITRGSTCRCVLGTLGQMIGSDYVHSFDGTARATFAARVGLTHKDVDALEAGFEQTTFPGCKHEFDDLKKNRYYKVGMNVARQVGYLAPCNYGERYERSTV
jgi:hypothetical protein